MKILFVTETLPYPLDRGGFIRSSHLIQKISGKHELTLISSHEDVNNPGVEFYKKFCHKVICLPKPKISKPKLIYYVLSSITGSRPYPLNKNFSYKILAEINKELETGKYDILHCDHLDTAQYLPLIKNPTHTVFDTHNILSILIERLTGSEKCSLKRAFIRFQNKKIKNFEAILSGRFDRCLVCSEEDKNQLIKLNPQAKIEIVPNGVDLNYYNIESNPGKNPSLLFIGRLDYLPNSQGVMDFYENVWPLLIKEIPNMQWQIIGGSLPSSLNKLARNKNIKLIANALDMRPYLASSALSIVPLKIGGGTRLKILESMAAGVPVISTAIGAEGIDAINGREIIIYDDSQNCASHIINLCREEKERLIIAQNAKKFVEKFDWEIIGDKLLNCYNTL